MKKSLSILLVFALALSSVFAGGAKESSANEVYFLNFKPEIADVYTDIVAPAFEEETGLKLRVVTAASNQYQTTLRSEMAKSNPPVIFQVNGPIGVQAFTNDVAPLEDTGFYALLADKSMAIEQDGHVVGIPYAVEGYGIIYNDAIMRKYFALPDKTVDISSADEIRSFDTLKAVVEDMSKHLDELGIQGVFASTSMASGTDWRWQTHLFNMPLWKEFGDILTTTEAASFEFTYNENYKALWDLYLDNSTTPKGMVSAKTDADSMAEFALGQCAMVQNGNWGAAQILGQAGNVVASEDIKFLPLYMGFDGEENQGICVGTENYLSINIHASEEAKKNADTFLTWLFSSDTGKKIVKENLMFITPFNSFTEEELPEDPLAKEVNRWMNMDGVTSVPWAFQGIPSEQWKSDFGGALLQYINGTMDWSEVVEIAKKSWTVEAEIAGR